MTVSTGVAMAGEHETVEEKEGNANFHNRKGIHSVVRKPNFAASLQALFYLSSRSRRATIIPATSSSVYSSTRIERMRERRSGFATEVEFEVDASRDHWSELQLDASSDHEDEAAQTNAEIVESLRRQWPETGVFFHHFGDTLKVGAKIAEGAQAEIFEVEDPLDKTVLKLFKEGASVRDLQRQWPPGMLQQNFGMFWSFGSSAILRGTVVMNGRFGFLMFKRWGDLRKLIDFRMQHNQHPPFSHKELVRNMLEIAQGMEGLHERNIVHRDLKASNVLIWKHNVSHGSSFDPFLDSYSCEVAEYECSLGVVGTGFWRSPEILKAMKNRNVTSNLFTEKSDAYSFAMTCYEMITGKLPFEDVRLNDYDVVLKGDRPTLPKDTDPMIEDLLNRCWHPDPLKRPDFQEIVKFIEHSISLLDTPLVMGRGIQCQARSDGCSL